MVELENKKELSSYDVDGGINSTQKIIETLRESEKRYNQIFNNMTEGFALHEIVYDNDNKPIDYKILEINDSFEKILGLSRKNTVGLLASKVYGLSSAPYLEIYSEVAKTQIPKTFETYSDFMKKYFTISVFSPEKEKFITIFSDITSKKIFEDELKNSKEILKTIIDLIPTRIFWKDKNLNYLGCNVAFAKDAGKNNSNDLVGKSDYDMNWKEQAEAYRADDMEVINFGKSKVNYEEVQTTPTGGKIFLLTSKVPLKDTENNSIGVLGTYSDITDHKKIQEEIIKKSQELEKFNSFAVDRELKMIELKTEVNELLKKLGQEVKYSIDN